MLDGSAITIEISGAPVPWARTGGNGKRRFTPAKMGKWKDVAGLYATVAMAGRKPLTGPLLLTYTAIYEIPKSWPKWKRQAAVDGHIGMTSAPDLDNLVKCTGDAFNKIVYTDDALITKGAVNKIYGPVAKVVATVTRLDQLPNTCTRTELNAFLELGRAA